MTRAERLPEQARAEVRRIVLVSRAAGVAIAATLALASLYIHRDDPSSLASVTQLVTVAVGLGAFITISTLTRVGHARILERSLAEVQDLTAQLRGIAETDPLTGLYNLRAFQERLQGELDAAHRTGVQVSLIVSDLDNFKLLNDSFGHQFGDEILRRTAQVFAARGGVGACAARLGGDEFAIVLTGACREDAVRVAREIEDTLREMRVDHRQPLTLGSFGIATYPQDGENVQALFAAADGRMYSEKHRRKAETLSSLAGATRKLFVRVGRAMRPEHTTAQILERVAEAARDELALSVCAVAVKRREHHPPIAAAAATDPDLERSCIEAAEAGALRPSALAALLPRECWLIETPIRDDQEDGGTLILAGLPTDSFRPDASVVLAVADLIQAVVANGRAHSDAVRAGRERDVHIELARALAGGGTLDERLAQVARLIAGATHATGVIIEGLADAGSGGGAAANITAGAGIDVLIRRDWDVRRALPEGRAFLSSLVAEAPCVIEDVVSDQRIPEVPRKMLRLAGIRTAAVCPIRFNGEVLGLLAAASVQDGFFNEDLMTVLMTMADHLAPAVKVALLREELEASYGQLEQASRESLARLADAAEARDPHTGGHLRRIRRYSIELARELGVPEDEAQCVGAASAVHDLGKLRLPDAVLNNPGKLSEDDWERMREHPTHGERLIGDSPMFEIERAVARWHHERWDGSGYPDGLKGEEIPLCARIVAVADAFDALTTERPYKPAWPLHSAFAEIDREKGKLFCPTVVSALETLWRSGRLAGIYETVEHEESGEHSHARAA